MKIEHFYGNIYFDFRQRVREVSAQRVKLNRVNTNRRATLEVLCFVGVPIFSLLCAFWY